MKIQIVKITMAAALAGLSAYFGALLIPLALLIAVSLLDYLTGIGAAIAVRGGLDSKTAALGAIKKLGYFAAVVAAGVLDWLLSEGLNSIGIDIHLPFLIGAIVCIWLIITELISILENLEDLGIRIPFLSGLIKKVKGAVEKAAENVVIINEKESQDNE
jgi:toxin secretion/phage lysis holin